MAAISYGAVRDSEFQSSRPEGKNQFQVAANTFGDRFFSLGYWREFREILRLHLPAFLTCFCQFFLQTTSLLMCGHLSKEELDAVALACSLINVAGLGIGIGLSTGCDTYFSQTYGSGKLKRMGLYLQRSLIVMYMAVVPVYCLHLNIRPVLLLLGQDECISEMAAQYILLFMPGVFFDFSFLVLSRYLQTQNCVYPPLVCALIGNVFNAISQYVAIYVIGFRYEASAVCQAASIFVMGSTLLLYILISGVYKDTWPGWTREAWYDIGGFVKLAVPGLVFVGLEEISFEVGTFIAGGISNLQLAAQGIVFQCAALSYMVSLGMSIAVNIRVGQHLGAGRTAAARHTYRVALTMIFCFTVAMAMMFLFGNEFIVGLFTSDASVREAAAEVLTVFSFFPIIDGIASTGSGVLKGCGKQMIGAITGIFAYYAIGLPIGIPLSLLTALQIRGIWIGLLLGVFFEVVVFWTVVYRIDWPSQVTDAQSRASGKASSPAAAAVSDISPLLTGSTKPEETAIEASMKHQVLGHSRSASLMSHSPYSNVAADIEISDSAELPPLASVLLRRIITICVLAIALAAAVILRLMQTDYLPLAASCQLPAANHSAAHFID